MPNLCSIPWNRNTRIQKQPLLCMRHIQVISSRCLPRNQAKAMRILISVPLLGSRVYRISQSVPKRDNFGPSRYIEGRSVTHLSRKSAKQHPYTISSQSLWEFTQRGRDTLTHGMVIPELSLGCTDQNTHAINNASSEIGVSVFERLFCIFVLASAKFNIGR